ncbi:unnamed protein product [Closterium sp. Yama58-4]|nr:unnamed protein product [Closterium sp. Yama58-4]
MACEGVPELREVTFAYPSLSDVSALVSLLCLSLFRPSALPLSPAPQTACFRSPLPFVFASRVPGSHSHPYRSLPSFFSPSPGSATRRRWGIEARNCRGGRSMAWRSRGRFCGIRGCCCWTRRRRRWTRRARCCLRSMRSWARAGGREPLA